MMMQSIRQPSGKCLCVVCAQMNGWTNARSFDPKGMESHYKVFHKNLLQKLPSICPDCINRFPNKEARERSHSCRDLAITSEDSEDEFEVASLFECQPELPRASKLVNLHSYLKIGVIGYPNVGKSTLFNLLTEKTISVDNFMFSTVNTVYSEHKIPDTRFELLCEIYKPIKRDMQHIDLLLRDIEGLVAWRRSPFLQEKHDCCERIKECLNDGQNVRFGDWLEEYIPHLKEMKLITAKPVVYLINVREEDYISKSNIFLASIHKWVMENGAEPIIPFCGTLETRFAELQADWSQHQFNRIIKAAIAATGTIFCYTADEYKVQRWQFSQGFTARKAAAIVETDKAFKSMEVIKYKDFECMRSVAAVKACQSYLYKDGSYCVEDGDIIFIQFFI